MDDCFINSSTKKMGHLLHKSYSDRKFIQRFYIENKKLLGYVRMKLNNFNKEVNF